MKRLAKSIVSGIDHMVNFIALMLILLLMFLSCYMLWDSNQVFEAADAKNYEAYMPSENHTKSFEELQKINPDVFGWIRINDTNVNYPLLQAEDDDTYMNTDAEGNYSLSGSIFLHCANSPDFSDFNNLIYGHHMEKHKMFGDVGLFTEKKYFDEHPYGNLFFDGKDHGIEFYALLQADAYNERLFSVCPETSEAKQEYLQEILDNALYKRNLNVTEEDHLVLLITCTSEMTNGRNILVGRLTEQVYPEKEKPKNVGTGIDQIRKLVISVPVLFWLILLLLILLILDLEELNKKQVSGLIIAEDNEKFVPNILTQYEYIRQKRENIEYIKKINILDQCVFYLVITEVNEPLIELDFITLENVIIKLLYILTQVVTEKILKENIIEIWNIEC